MEFYIIITKYISLLIKNINGEAIMKKPIIILLCLLIISCGIGCVCASDDIANATVHQDFLQNETQNVTVNNTTIVINQNSTAPAIENITADDNNATQSNETSANITNNNTNASNIPGPKTNGLNITGPKTNSTGLVIEGPVIIPPDLNDHDYCIKYFSTMFAKHPEWKIDDILRAVLAEYPWYKVPKMVPEAYAEAIKIKGDEMYYHDGLDLRFVEMYMVDNYYDLISPNDSEN